MDKFPADFTPESVNRGDFCLSIDKGKPRIIIMNHIINYLISPSLHKDTWVEVKINDSEAFNIIKELGDLEWRVSVNYARRFVTIKIGHS